MRSLYQIIGCIFAVDACVCCGIKVIHVCSNLLPPAHQTSYNSIVNIAVFFKETCISYAVFANTVRAEIIIEAVNQLNARQFYTAAIIAVALPTVLDFDQNAVLVLFSVCIDTVIELAARSALQNAVQKVITVTGCRNGRTPVDDGIASGASRSASVAIFRAGRSLVSNCFGSMIVPFTDRILQVCDRRIQFGLYIRADIGETGNIAGFRNCVSIRIND